MTNDKSNENSGFHSEFHVIVPKKNITLPILKINFKI